MYVKNLIFAILLCIIPTLVKAQTFTYSYADPCTGIIKTINVPTNGVTVTYFGQMNTFSPADFNNGVFNNWANNVYSSFGGNNPCGSTIGITTSISMAQNSAMNVLGILNSIDALSDMAGAGSFNANGVVESSKTSSKKSDKKNNKKNDQGSTNGSSNTSGTTNVSTTGSTTGSGSNTTGTTNGSGSSSTGLNGGSINGSTSTTGNTTSGSTTGTGNSTEGSNVASSNPTTGTNSNNSTSSGSTSTNSESGSNGSNGTSSTNGSNGTSSTNGSASSSGSINGSSTSSTGTNGSTSSSGSTNGSNGSTTSTNGSTNSSGSSNGSNTSSTGTNGSNGTTSSTSNPNTSTTNNTETNSSNTTSTETSGGSTGANTTGSTTSGTGTTGTGTGTGTGSNGGESGSGNTPPNNNSNGTDAATNEEKKSSNVLGGSVGSIQNSTSGGSKSGNKEGGKPSIVLSSDFAGFNFKQGDVSYGGKGTGGWTSLNWDGTKSHGVMLDYTTANKGPNLTAFYALIKKRRIDLISVTGTTSFYGKGSLYGTIAIGQMWSFPKVKSLKAIYMATSSMGNVFGTKFIGTAFIAGGMYDMKLGKRTQVKFTNLFIYAPYISYYNDMVLKSPYVIMPIIGTNIGVTKKFKLNVNLGGTYAIGENVLNFTFMMGTRLAL